MHRLSSLLTDCILQGMRLLIIYGITYWKLKATNQYIREIKRSVKSKLLNSMYLHVLQIHLIMPALKELKDARDKQSHGKHFKFYFK